MATVHETEILRCEVETGSSNPMVQFFWTLNDTTRIESVANDQIQSAGKVSILKYTPETEEDFGVIACWAQNDIGTQKIPCYFYLTPACKQIALIELLENVSEWNSWSDLSKIRGIARKLNEKPCCVFHGDSRIFQTQFVKFSSVNSIINMPIISKKSLHWTFVVGNLIFFNFVSGILPFGLIKGELSQKTEVC